MRCFNFTYPGKELDVFGRAENWKKYLRSILGCYIGKRVLEVGAGLGSTTKVLCTGVYERWLCLEPDRYLAGTIFDAIERKELPSCCQVIAGDIDDLSESDSFDTILYIDVLEHIQDDNLQVIAAASHLLPYGHLIAVCPAHQWLFTSFDKAIGHFRRYNRISIGALTPSGFAMLRCIYVDSLGLIASLFNRYLLKSANPSRFQIEFWDRLLVPISRVVDSISGYHVGKSIIAVWQKRGEIEEAYQPIAQVHLVTQLFPLLPEKSYTLS